MLQHFSLISVNDFTIYRTNTFGDYKQKYIHIEQEEITSSYSLNKAIFILELSFHLFTLPETSSLAMIWSIVDLPIPKGPMMLTDFPCHI